MSLVTTHLAVAEQRDAVDDQHARGEAQPEGVVWSGVRSRVRVRFRFGGRVRDRGRV